MVIFFNEGTLLMKRLRHKLDLIIVDDYFCDNPPEDHNFNDLMIGLNQVATGTPIYFFSPLLSGKARKSVKVNHYYTCLAKGILALIIKENNLLTAVWQPKI